MTKPIKKAAKPAPPRNEIFVTYEGGGLYYHVVLRVPVAPERGEAIINEAAKHGCTDIEAVRAQIRKHY